MGEDTDKNPLTVLQSGEFSFLSCIRIDGKHLLYSVTLKHKGKLYRFKISDLSLITAENQQEIEE
jgi:hypothetical protein